MPREQREICNSGKSLERYGKCLESHGKFLESYRELLENYGQFLESRTEFLESCRGTPGKQKENSKEVGYKFLESWREFLMQ